MDEETTTLNPDAPGFYDGQEILGIGRKEEKKVDPEQEEIKTKLEQYDKLKNHLGEDNLESLLEDADYEEAEIEKRLKEDPEYANRLRTLVTKVDADEIRARDQEIHEKAMELIGNEFPHLKNNILEVQAFFSRAVQLNPRADILENVRIACNNATTYLGLEPQVQRKRHSEYIKQHEQRRRMFRQVGSWAVEKQKRKGER